MLSNSERDPEWVDASLDLLDAAADDLECGGRCVRGRDGERIDVSMFDQPPCEHDEHEHDRARVAALAESTAPACCPVCGGPVDVERIDACTRAGAAYVAGRWECPNGCDPNVISTRTAAAIVPPGRPPAFDFRAHLRTVRGG